MLLAFVRNAALPDDVRVNLERELIDRIVSYSGGEEQAVKYWKAPDRLINPCSHFNRYAAQATCDAFNKMNISPSLRREIKFSIINVP